MQIKDFLIDKSLKELTEHRTVVFQIACYETKVNQNSNGYIPIHWHDELQFVLVRKGEVFFQINEEKMTIREGEGLFNNSGCLHMAKDQYDSSCAYICLNVSPSFIFITRTLYPLCKSLYSVDYMPYIHLVPKEFWAKNILDSMMKINHLKRRLTLKK
mgnify:CR=1 FL=1